jgi:hypothetical protein
VPGFGCLVGLAVFSLGEVRWGVVVLLPVPYSPRSNAWCGSTASLWLWGVWEKA